jgi:hypothetical protein
MKKRLCWSAVLLCALATFAKPIRTGRGSAVFPLPDQPTNCSAWTVAQSQLFGSVVRLTQTWVPYATRRFLNSAGRG